MSRLFFSPGCMVVGALFTAAIIGENSLAAQETESVKVATVDGVRLNAVFYPSKKKNAPVVIMLHPVGEGKSIRSPEWKTLAEKLQKDDFAVVMFDFRGHGESTTIDLPDTFWTVQANNRYVRAKSKDVIDVKDYIKSTAYLPVLVNDIAAIKAFLDRKNDAGACNTANTFIVGADNGATLGALWMNAEWCRYKYTPAINFMPEQFSKRAEGNDILGAVFLTIQPKLAPGKSVSVTGLLRSACKEHGAGVAFFYGKEDAANRKFAKTLETNLKVKKSKKHKFIGAVELPTNLTGVKMLQKGLGTDGAIVDYLKLIVADRNHEWLERNFQDTQYVWRAPALNYRPIPAKVQKGAKNLLFDTYDKFLAQ